MSRTMVAVALLALVVVAWAAERKNFLTDDPYDRDVITIVSDAPLEYMVTRTQEVRGAVDINPANVLDAPQAKFELDVDKLSTGQPVRDEHMRGEGWLESTRYPRITFELASVKSPTVPLALEPGRALPIDVIGKLTIRDRTVEVPAAIKVTLLPADETTVQRLPGDILKLEAEFDFYLSDFGVTIPAPAALKVNNRQHVTARILASTERVVPREG